MMLFIFWGIVLYFSIIKKILFMNKQDFDNLSKIQTEVWNLQNDFATLSARQMGLSEKLNTIASDLDQAMESIRKADAGEPVQEAAPLIAPPPLPVQEELASAPVSETQVSAPVSETSVSALVSETSVSAPEKVAAVPEPVADAKPEVEEKKKVFDLEKFIGENLLSKIGVLIILVGVAIFGKYAIDNNLISPLARIMLGSGFGLALIGVGFWLKKSVEKLSAMLVAGGTAVLYLMTYFAYDFYQMMSMMAAGGLMLLISAFTIWSGVFYKKEVIAIYGQLCSYVIPLAISNGTGNLMNFFTYIVIINAVITVLTVIFKWRISYGLSFVATCFVELWIRDDYDAGSMGELPKMIALMAANMVVYYVSMAWIKSRDGVWLASYDTLMVVGLTLLFFNVGYGQAWMGLGFNGCKLAVVIITMVVNLAMAAWLYTRNDSHCKALGHSAVACVVLAVGFAFFDFFGICTYVVLLALLMATMYYFAEREKCSLFRIVSYIIMAAIMISFMVIMVLCLGWRYTEWSSVVSILIVAAILVFMIRAKTVVSGEVGTSEHKFLVYAVMSMLWTAASVAVMIANKDCLVLSAVAALVIITAASYLFSNVWDWGKTFRSELKFLAIVIQFLSVPTLISMIDSQPDYLVARYLSWVMLAACFYLNHNKELANSGVYVVALLTSLFAITSFEIYYYAEERFVLSIWWGVFAVACMYVGLVRRSKLFRVYGIVVLCATLLKLFFMDLTHLTTMSKVAIFIGLGVLMLIGTYFYQKISKDENDESGENKE